MQISHINTCTPKFYGNRLRNINRVLPKVTTKDLGGLVLAPVIAAAGTVIATNNITKKETPKNDQKDIKQIEKDLKDYYKVYSYDYWFQLKNAIDSLYDSPEKDRFKKIYTNRIRIMMCAYTFAKSIGEKDITKELDAAEACTTACSIQELFQFFEKNPNLIDEFEQAVKLPLKELHYLRITDLKHKGSKEKVEFFLENKDLRLILEDIFNMTTPYSPKDIIDEPKITCEICEQSMIEVDKSLDANLLKNPETKGDLFVFSCYKNAGCLSQKDFDIHLETLKYLYANTDKNTARLIASSINDDYESIFIRRPHNLDAAIHYIENNTDFNKEYLHSILKTDLDWKANNAVLESLMNNRDKLLKTVKERTRHADDKFKEWVEDYLSDSQNIKNLLCLYYLNADVLINGLYGLSKLITCMQKKPEDYVSGDCKNLNKDEIMIKFHAQIKLHFTNNYEAMLKAIIATDLETVKLFMDKRLNKFNSKLKQINKISPVYQGILSDLVRNGRQINKLGEAVKLSGNQKETLVNIIYNYSTLNQTSDIDIDPDKYKTPIADEKFILDIDMMQKDLFILILKQLGFSEEDISNLKPENMNWDKRYISHFISEEVADSKDLQTLIKVASEGRFADFIKDPNNKYGKANLETEKIFNSRNLNYDVWLDGIGEKKFTVSGEEYTINLWKRIPQESIFDGEYTTCCTAINESKGKYMPIYMMSTAFNVIEVKDSDGNTVGMARFFMAETENGKNALIIEGLEYNNKLISKMKAEYKQNRFIWEITDYLKDFASKVAGEDIPTYISIKNPKITNDQFRFNDKIVVPISLLGEVAANQVYFNTLFEEINPSQLKNRETELYIAI